MGPEERRDRHDALAPIPQSLDSFDFLLRQRGSITATRVCDDIRG